MKVLLIIAAILAGIIGILYFFVGWMFDSWDVVGDGFYHNIWLSLLFPNGVNIFMATPGFWVIVAIIAIIVLFAVFGDEYEQPPLLIGAVVILVIGSILYPSLKGWVLSENGAKAYLSTTTFVVEDENDLPLMMQVVESSNESMVPIEEGDFPDEWARRVASFTGAQLLLARTSESMNNVDLLDDTVTYIYNEDGDGGVWTGIRNGKGLQDIYGVATWDGSGEDVGECVFKDDYELHQTFGGMWHSNLWNDIAEKYSFSYNESDMWGYCDGAEPIIVLPVTTTIAYDVRTIDESAGIITIQGSPNGEPVITHVPNAEPGDYPGPVYAQRLVNQQMGALEWAAGRHQQMHVGFGFVPTELASQGGNNSNYLLKDPEDGRLYWVTPLKPRSTDSNTVAAYSVVPADEVVSGDLNEQRVYVLNEGDPRRVDLDNLAAAVEDRVRFMDPGFFTGSIPGRIAEFLPVSDNVWQAFAEVNGRVKYRIDITVGSTIQMQVVTVDGTSDGEVVATCDIPTTLDEDQIADCIASLAEELQNR